MNFVDGLAGDAEAVTNRCSEPWSNGMVEGFIHKVKWIKCSSCGQAGFSLLQRRVLLHPTREEKRAVYETALASRLFFYLKYRGCFG
jgi:hypothetical protein